MLAAETGIAPSALLAESRAMLNTLYDYLVWRADQQNRKPGERTDERPVRTPKEIEGQRSAFVQWAAAHGDG